jgi:hypothetical protein
MFDSKLFIIIEIGKARNNMSWHVKSYRKEKHRYYVQESFGCTTGIMQIFI